MRVVYVCGHLQASTPKGKKVKILPDRCPACKLSGAGAASPSEKAGAS